MKILHVCGKRDWGGGENQLALLLEALSKNQETFQQSLLCPEGSDMYKYLKTRNVNIDLHTSKKKINLDPRFVFKIYSVVKHRRIDLIHVHDPDAHSLVVLAIDLFRLQTKVVLHKKTVFPIKDKKYSIYKYNHPAIKQIICVSEASKNSILTKIKTTPIAVIYDAIELKVIEKTPRKSPVFTVLNVANHTRHKNLFTLLEIANKCIHEKKLPFRFIQLGHGKLTPELLAKRDELNLTNYFDFKGFVTNAQDYFLNADAFLFTSVREGLGVSVLEAIQYKLPVVSSNAGGIPEVIEDNVNGLLCGFDSVDCYVQNLVQVFETLDLVARLTENASKKVASEFSTENMVEGVKAIYLNLK
jgi:glycosyltransferase involved in cell wall biosynthesis